MTDAGAVARFWGWVEPLAWTDCLVYVGSGDYGYGTFWGGDRNYRAHRYAWELEHGPIPDGMVIDHVCHIRSCVNVEHLRLATLTENARSRTRKRNYPYPRGVQRTPEGRYTSKVGLHGKQVYLGTYDTPEEAGEIARAKRDEWYGEFAGRDTA